MNHIFTSVVEPTNTNTLVGNEECESDEGLMVHFHFAPYMHF